MCADVGNGASERIMVKLSMRLEREMADPGCRHPIRVYEITKTQYLSY